MPNLNDREPEKAPAKILFIGESGAGKTGALASLATKYKLYIHDFDNGLEILADPKVLAPEFRKNVFYKTFTDKMEDNGNGQMICKDPKAWQNSLKAFQSWKEKEGDKEVDHGGIYTWGPDKIVVIDSATIQGQACMRYVQHINGKSGTRPTTPQWGDAIDRQRSSLQCLYAEAVKCNVIVTAHVKDIDLNYDTVADPENDPTYVPDVRTYPTFLGKDLAKNGGQFFNTTIMALMRGTRRIIRTRTEGRAGLKISAPSKIPSELPLETGMLELFQRLTSK